MNRSVFACLALGSVLLAGCVSQTTAAPSFVTPEDEAANASRVYYDCIRSSDHQLDDGKSDVSTIALGIEAKCAAPYASLKDVLTRNMGFDAKQKLEGDMDANQPGQIERLVEAARGVTATAAKSN